MQELEPGTAVILLLTDEDVLRLHRLTGAGVEHKARRDGGTNSGDKALLERLDRVAQQARNRLRARSTQGCATTLAADDTASGSSGPSWPVSVAARRYGTSSSYLRRLAATGALKARRGPTGGWLLDAASLEEWDASRATRVRTERAAA